MSAVPEERIAVDGIAAEATITIDRWGIPHMRAESLHDVFFAQGFNAARDRLWQIDLWRKRGLGLLAAELGPGFLAQDRASRLFLYRGDMAAEWAAYAPDTRMICEAFVAGINAYIRLAEHEPERLPPEFAKLGTRPQRWAAEDVLRIRSHGLTRNALSEIVRTNVLARADEATDLLRKNLEPPVTPRRPPSIDLAAIPLEAADVFKLAGAGVTITPERLVARLDDAWKWAKVTDLGEVLYDAAAQGSNNWAVSPGRTATGRPILASDPHRAHAVPSLRYLAHLTAPGLDAIGAGEPAVPGVSFGHNAFCAFAMTIFCSDQEDVYVYETNPGNPHEYRFGESWEPMRIIEEKIAVKGAPDQLVTLRFTRHGAVIWQDAAKNLACAVRTMWFEPGSAAYLASLSGMRAGSFEEFRAAMRRWGSPGGNEVYADVTGRIAWMPVGFMPRRPDHDGLLPVPGDGRCEWQGFYTQDELPRLVDPPEGFVATANEMNLPADWDHQAKPIGFEWTERSRATRIREALSADAAHTLAAAGRLQTDTLSVPARRLCRLLAPLGAEGAGAAALALLRRWDHRLDAGSAAAALFEVWWMLHLRPALAQHLVPDAAVRALLVPLDMDGVLAALERPDARWGADPARARDRLLLDTLAKAWADVAARLGADPAGWAWGRLHQGYFEHGLSNTRPPEERPAMDVGPLPKGGSSSTPMHTGYRLTDFRIIHGASFRMVADVGNWDASLCMNSPGQSGDPRSPHYRDLAPLWAKGEYIPMPFSQGAVEAAAEKRIVLVPKRE